MRRLIGPVCSLLCILLDVPAAKAQALWVGKWFGVPEANRRSAHSFILLALPGGRLRYDNGSAVLIFGPGEKPMPEPNQLNLTVRTLKLTSSSLRFEEITRGKVIERVEEWLSDNGRQLVGHRTYVDKNGRGIAQDIIAVRFGTGHGLAGHWRELPPHAQTGEPTRGPSQPFWIISQAARGVITWTIPSTGEVLHGAADGRPHPVKGPAHPLGRTFTLTALSPHHLRFDFFDNGHPIERADETLSADGRRWTDLLWVPAYPDEKDRYVYDRK